MKMKILIAATLCLVSYKSFANRDDFDKPSSELAAAMMAAATSLGYDLSNAEGHKKFGDYLKSQKDVLAKNLSIDTSTEDGRKKMHDSIKAHVDEIAKTQGFDMSTQEGRDSLEKYLISKQEYSYLRQPEQKEKIVQRQANQQQIKSNYRGDGPINQNSPSSSSQQQAPNRPPVNSGNQPSAQQRH